MRIDHQCPKCGHPSSFNLSASTLASGLRAGHTGSVVLSPEERKRRSDDMRSKMLTYWKERKASEKLLLTRELP